MTTTNLSILQFHETLKGLENSDKSARIIEFGFVKSNGKTDWTGYYTAVLAARDLLPKVPETQETMFHFVAKYATENTIQELRCAWEDYKEQSEVDGNYDSVDAFIEEYGLNNICFYAEYADAVNDNYSEIVDAFVGHYGISQVSNFTESFCGVYDSEAKFAEEYYDNLGESVPVYVIINWEATWDCGLRHEYTYDDATGAVFADNY